ncbi:hypothetical protein [Subdoligranulum variabile]|uniref:Uncharacterized protein n=1 Tax=Subdoligranulum variabile DSM 15176 TaxID=411471 RepID=D1PJU3_9FIRM|nr:hypothetical protein [Subdoligranulum variabile]EFB77041.1 hypothetical protein SUBVAR_04663 [Subdoligranulum variabile DSM 15176]UWP67702.1 hypothetical protein NQ490_12255 [Subdoligranulum variabile]
MNVQYVTVVFSTEKGARTLEECLEQLLCNLDLEKIEKKDA